MFCILVSFALLNLLQTPLLDCQLFKRLKLNVSYSFIFYFGKKKKKLNCPFIRNHFIFLPLKEKKKTSLE